MAVNDSRSMNAELRHGMLEGSVKETVKNRGGVVENTASDARRGLAPYYGFNNDDGVVELPVPDFMKIRT